MSADDEQQKALAQLTQEAQEMGLYEVPKADDAAEFCPQCGAKEHLITAVKVLCLKCGFIAPTNFSVHKNLFKGISERGWHQAYLGPKDEVKGDE